MPKKVKEKQNFWYEHHTALSDAEKIKCRDRVCELCEISIKSFYRYIQNPLSLKAVEKMVVAKAYGVALQDFFPETEPILFD